LAAEPAIKVFVAPDLAVSNQQPELLCREGCWLIEGKASNPTSPPFTVPVAATNC